MNIRKYSLELVKESSTRYEYILNKNCNTPEFIYQLMLTVGLHRQPNEQMYVVLLDSKNRCIGLSRVATGTLSMLIVDPGVIAKIALLANAHAVVLCHQHPSGSTTPSQEDIKTTQTIGEALKLLGVRLTDHLIIGDGAFCSLRRERSDMVTWQ